MKKFIDTVNKKELLVSEELYHVDNFIDKLEDNGIYVASNVNVIDYTEALEDITEAFLDIVDDLEEEDNYFRLPTQKELLDEWNESGWKDLNEPFDKELATEFYYSDCIREAINEDAYEFLSWLDSQSRFFTYITIDKEGSDYWYDLIEYHPHTNLESDLLVDDDELRKNLFDDWFFVEDEEGNQEEFSLESFQSLDRYMFEKYNAIEVTK